MNPDARDVTQRNDRHPLQVPEKCIQTACLPHERNTCCRANGQHAAAYAGGERTEQSLGDVPFRFHL